MVAHLSAAANTGRLAWLRSMLGARNNAAKLPKPPWLGEVVVHAQDVRHPLGLTREIPVSTVTAVAHFFARRDFAVNSRSVAKGLALRATDGPFSSGQGLEVHGTTPALTMAMAGRRDYVEELTGPGVETLQQRVP